MSHIEPGTFMPLHKLHVLNLSNNRLTQFNVTEQLTTAMNQLTNLNLDDNQLTELPDGIEGMLSRLKVFSIKNNRFDCTYLQALDIELKNRSSAQITYLTSHKSCK